MSTLMKYRSFAVWLLLGLAYGCGTQLAQELQPAGPEDAGSIDDVDEGQDLPVDRIDDTARPPGVIGNDNIAEPAPVDPIDPIVDEPVEPSPDETQLPEEEEEVESPIVLGPDDLLGAWKVESGAASVSNFQPERGFATTHVEFSSNGIATLFSKSSFGGTVANLSATFDVVDNELLLDSETDAFDGLVFKLEMPNDDELTATDALGEVSQLLRVDAVPAEARTRPLFVIKTHRFASSPHESTGLAFHKGLLWFTLGNLNLGTFSPNTEQFLALLSLNSEFKFVQSRFSTGFTDTLVLSCSCVDSAAVLERHRFSDPIMEFAGSIDFDPMAQQGIVITAAAGDSFSETIWASSELNTLHSIRFTNTGKVFSDSRFHTLDGLAFDGTMLWGLDRAGKVIVQIDPVGGQATQSRLIPGVNIDWYDLEFIGDRIFVLGKDIVTTQTVLVEVTTRLSVVGGVGGVGGGSSR